MQTIPVEKISASDIDEVDYDASLEVKDARSYNQFIVNGYMDEFKYSYRILTDTGKIHFGLAYHSLVGNDACADNVYCILYIAFGSVLEVFSLTVLQRSRESLSDMTLTLT